MKNADRVLIDLGTTDADGSTVYQSPARQPTADDWKQECIYISRVTDKRGNVREMNHDVDTFRRYCEMQRDSAARQGFHDSAEYIQHCIDDLTAK